MSFWPLPDPPVVPIDFDAAYKEFLVHVNEVNHSEFERAAKLVLHSARLTTQDGQQQERPAPVAIQRCRRGGKTFMLHAVAALLQDEKKKAASSPTFQIIMISLSDVSRFDPEEEDAYQAILSRIAWEMSGREGGRFEKFRKSNSDFGEVDDWLCDAKNPVILLVDELNAIGPCTTRYKDMCALLAHLVGQKGSAVLYSTHQRNTANLLRERLPGSAATINLSQTSHHHWAQIPRIQTAKCLQGLLKDSSKQPSFWCAVLRGRIPALVVQTSEIPTYSRYLMSSSSSSPDGGSDMTIEEERRLCLAAVITGNIDQLPNDRQCFRAYSYMSERFQALASKNQVGEYEPIDPTEPVDDSRRCFAWPPFMIAQPQVLGKSYHSSYH